jgi:hypothetical protein
VRQVRADAPYAGRWRCVRAGEPLDAPYELTPGLRPQLKCTIDAY